MTKRASGVIPCASCCALTKRKTSQCSSVNSRFLRLGDLARPSRRPDRRVGKIAFAVRFNVVHASLFLHGGAVSSLSSFSILRGLGPNSLSPNKQGDKNRRPESPRRRARALALARAAGANLRFAGSSPLDRWARRIAVGTKDAAVAGLGAEHCATIRAFIKELAGVSRHGFRRSVSTLRTRDRRMQDGRRLICHRQAPSTGRRRLSRRPVRQPC